MCWMDAVELDHIRRQHQQWEIEEIQAALRDADSGRVVEHVSVPKLLSINATNLVKPGDAKIFWAQSFLTRLKQFLEYNRQCVGGSPFEWHFDRLVSTIEFLRDRPHVGHSGRVLGTTEWSFDFAAPILVYRVVRTGELQVLGELRDPQKGRPRPIPARA
jgi:hypothetical protein